MSNSILDQADALMRRRNFVAGAKPTHAETAANTLAVDETAIEDVPVLTDVVDDDVTARHTMAPGDEADNAELAAGAALEAEQALRGHLNQLLLDRQSLLAQEIEAWLDEQMPQLVIRAMDGITDHLVSLLANRARDELLPRLEAALKPLDGPAADGE